MPRLYGRWAFLIKGIGVLVAAAWAVWEFYSHDSDGRVQAALEYRRQLHSSPLFEAWQRAVMEGTLDTPEKLAAEKAWGDVWMNWSIKHALSSNIRPSLETIISFYDEVWACYNERVCTHSTTLDLFGGEAELIVGNYVNYIECNREKFGDNKYASGVVSLEEAYRNSKGQKPYSLPKLKADECDRNWPSAASAN